MRASSVDIGPQVAMALTRRSTTLRRSRSAFANLNRRTSSVARRASSIMPFTDGFDPESAGEGFRAAPFEPFATGKTPLPLKQSIEHYEASGQPITQYHEGEAGADALLDASIGKRQSGMSQREAARA